MPTVIEKLEDGVLLLTLNRGPPKPPPLGFSGPSAPRPARECR